MKISSEKTNSKAAAAVRYAGRHPWAKLPCLCAVTAIYGAEWLRQTAREAGGRLAAADLRSLPSRALAAAVSGAFALMIIPAADISGQSVTDMFFSGGLTEENVIPDELPVPVGVTGNLSGNTATVPANPAMSSERPKSPSQVLYEKRAEKAAAENAQTPEEIADYVSYEGLAEGNADYGVVLNIGSLKKEVTVRFSSEPSLLPQVKECFENYDIPTDNLYILPVDVTVYNPENRHILNLTDGYSADITLPVPEEMTSHLDDLKIVRLDGGGLMTVIDGEFNEGLSGLNITFNTEHFSVFAIVSYSDEVAPEDIGSGTGASEAGSYTDTALSGQSPFDEDRKRFRSRPKCRKYRIFRIYRESERLL